PVLAPLVDSDGSCDLCHDPEHGRGRTLFLCRAPVRARDQPLPDRQCGWRTARLCRKHVRLYPADRHGLSLLRLSWLCADGLNARRMVAAEKREVDGSGICGEIITQD